MDILEACYLYSEVAKERRFIESSLWEGRKEWVIDVWCAEMIVPAITIYREGIQSVINKKCSMSRRGEVGVTWLESGILSRH